MYAIPFYEPPEEGKQMFVRINSKEKAGMLMNLAGIKDCGKGIRFYEEFYEEDQAFVFDMKEPVEK